MLPFLGKLQEAVLAMGPEGTRPGWHVAWLHVVVEELAATDDRAATGRPDEFRFVHKCASRAARAWSQGNHPFLTAQAP